jgi:hypothetical protein
MLHLRSRYVSKAAIFTVPVLLALVKKSKFRLNSKGLGRTSAAFWRRLFPWHLTA